jgi:cell division protein FtsL
MTTSPYLRRQPVKNFLLVRERDRRRLRELRLLAFAVIPAALALLAYTWLQTEIVRSGYRVRALERRLEEMAKTERQLELEASWLESLERVEAAAAEALEMQFPTLEQMVFVEAPGGGWEEGEAFASGAAIGSADALAAGGARVER